jgi:hypothetical protein
MVWVASNKYKWLGFIIIFNVIYPNIMLNASDRNDSLVNKYIDAKPFIFLFYILYIYKFV